MLGGSCVTRMPAPALAKQQPRPPASLSPQSPPGPAIGPARPVAPDPGSARLHRAVPRGHPEPAATAAPARPLGREVLSQVPPSPSSARASHPPLGCLPPGLNAEQSPPALPGQPHLLLGALPAFSLPGAGRKPLPFSSRLSPSLTWGHPQACDSLKLCPGLIHGTGTERLARHHKAVTIFKGSREARGGQSGYTGRVGSLTAAA